MVHCEILPVLAIIAALAVPSLGYSTGAPTALDPNVCKEQIPTGHGVPAKTSDFPMFIEVDSNDGTVKVSLTPVAIGAQFKGLLLTLRDSDGNTVGTPIIPEGYQSACDGHGITHKSPEPKSAIEFTFNDASDAMKLRLTLVQAKIVYWINDHDIQLAKDATITTTTTTTTTTPPPTEAETTTTPKPTTTTPELATTTTTPEPTTTTTTPEPTTTTTTTTTTTLEPVTTTPEQTTTPEPITTTPEPVTTTPELVKTTLLPATTAPESATTTPELETTTPEPVTTAPEPATTTPEPATTTLEPATTTPETATTPPEPATTTLEPGTTTPEPATTTPEPATTTPETATTPPEPATTTPEPRTTTLEPTATAGSEDTTTEPELTTRSTTTTIIEASLETTTAAVQPTETPSTTSAPRQVVTSTTVKPEVVTTKPLPTAKAPTTVKDIINKSIKKTSGKEGGESNLVVGRFADGNIGPVITGDGFCSQAGNRLEIVPGTDCTEFYMDFFTEYRRRVTLTCPPGLQLNLENCVCDYPANVNCVE